MKHHPHLLGYFTQEWRKQLDEIFCYGEEIIIRGQKVKELFNQQFMIDMEGPHLYEPKRKLSKKFLFAEAAWILSGSNSLSDIEPYNKNIKNFSDNGRSFHGAYGVPFTDQVDYVVKTLEEDRHSRQAGMTFWKQNPRKTLDVPCTISLFFTIRNRYLYTFVTMRSSDIWLGLPYDVFNFTMISYYILLSLKDESLKLGSLNFYAMNQHLYERDYQKASEILSTACDGCEPSLPLPWEDKLNETQELIQWLEHYRDIYAVGGISNG